jgi:hypothetical protein
VLFGCTVHFRKATLVQLRASIPGQHCAPGILSLVKNIPVCCHHVLSPLRPFFLFSQGNAEPPSLSVLPPSVCLCTSLTYCRSQRVLCIFAPLRFWVPAPLLAHDESPHVQLRHWSLAFSDVRLGGRRQCWRPRTHTGRNRPAQVQSSMSRLQKLRYAAPVCQHQLCSSPLLTVLQASLTAMAQCIYHSRGLPNTAALSSHPWLRGSLKI